MRPTVAVGTFRRQPKSYVLSHDVADAAAPAMVRAIYRAFREVQAGFSDDELVARYRDADPHLWTLDDWRRAVNTLTLRLATILGDAVMESVKAHARALPESRIRKDMLATLGTLGFRFDLVNDRAVQWANLHAAELVAGVSRETEAAIRAVIVRMYTEGLTPVRAAREIRQLIGLTQRGAMAVDNLRRNLERRLQLAQLARDAESAISPQQRAYWVRQQLLTTERIDRAVARYANRALRQRAELIARTESMTASNRGQQLMWQEARDRGLVDTDRVQRQWLITPDERLCPICRPMENQRTGLDEPFRLESGALLMAPPAHPRCRCTMRLVWLD